MRRLSEIPNDKRVLYIISTALVCLLLLLLILPIGQYKLILSLLLVAFAVATCLAVKKRSILSMHKWQVLFLIAVSAVLYLMIYYLTGIHFGFVRFHAGLSWSSFAKNIIPIAIIIIAIEIIRAVLLAQQNKLASILVFVSCVAVDMLISGSMGKIVEFNGFMDAVGMVFMPAITSGVLYHYLSKNYGMYPNIVFRLVTTLYAYIIPIQPAMPNAIKAFFRLFVPIILFLFIRALYEKNKSFVRRKGRIASVVASAFVAVVMISIVMLVSCQFSVGMIVIGSDSMTGEFNKGDAVIYHEYEDQKIQPGQVIVFNKNNIKVIHRVVDIQTINGQTRYYTKGDANDNVDDGYITRSDIVGITSLKVSYVGYPTLWLRGLFE